MEDPGTNPYAAPAATVSAGGVQDAAAPLFRVSGIAVATLFGTPIAGGWLMALNYRALGRAQTFLPTMALSVLATVALGALGALLPPQVPGAAFAAVQLIVMAKVARQAQGAGIDARIAAGLPMRSNWAAFGISLLVLAGVVGVFSLGVLAYLQATGLTWAQWMGATG